MISWTIQRIITAYLLSTSIFLLIILFHKPSRKRCNGFLHTSNFIIIIVLLVNIIMTGAEAFRCKAEQIKNVTSSSEGSLIQYNSHCMSIFLFTLLFAFLFQALFFFHKYRQKISFTIISMLLLAVFNNYETVVVFITHIFRDYLASSWSTYYETESRVWAVAFFIVYFLVCWIKYPRFNATNEVKGNEENLQIG